jgi:hypothetical protein
MLHSSLGTSKVTDASIYVDSASLNVVETTDKTAVDMYHYENGALSTPTPWGSTGDAPDGVVDLSIFDWSIVPRLISEVDSKVKTPNPTTRYIDVDPNWFGYGPCLLVYSSNEHSGGYMAVDLKGNIVKVFPYG